VFACIYGRVSPKNGSSDDVRQALLIDLAFTFSPFVERTFVDTVVLDISGDELLFSLQSQAEVNWTRSLGDEIARRAAESGLKVNVSVAANPDVAIHAARAFKGVICDDISEFESSLSGRVGVKRFQTAPSILVLMSLAGILASLRDRHSGPPMMGSEGCGGPISRYVLAVRLTAGIKTRNGLASSIVPAGTSLHRVGGIQFSPIAIVHN